MRRADQRKARGAGGASKRLIEIRNLSFRYFGKQDYALKNVSLDVHEGEFIVVAGKSGCGKTSLLRCMNGLIPHFYEGDFEGKVIVDGKDTVETPPHMLSQLAGMVFQNPENQLFALTVEADVAFPLENLGLPREVIKERIDWALKVLGIEELRDRSPFELSGGQKQKVALASVLAMKPKVLLLDEPTSSLDPLSAKSLIDSILELNKRDGISVVISEHRLELLLPYADRLIIMDEGRIVYDGDPREILKEEVSVYGISPPKVSEVAKHASSIGSVRFDPIPLSVEEFVDQVRRMIA